MTKKKLADFTRKPANFVLYALDCPDSTGNTPVKSTLQSSKTPSNAAVTQKILKIDKKGLAFLYQVV